VTPNRSGRWPESPNERYVSSWDLAGQVADQTITMEDWVAAVRVA